MKLQIKIPIIVVTLLVVIGTVISGVMFSLYDKANTAQLEQVGRALAGVVHDSLQQDMMFGELSHLRETLVHIAEEEIVNRVTLFSPQGVAVMSTETAEIGKMTATDEVRQALQSGKVITHSERQLALSELSMTLPVFNKPKCQGCHSPETEILGAVRVSLNTTQQNNQIRQQAIVLGVLGGLTFLITGGGLALLLRRTVLNPLASLATSTQRFSHGDYTVRVLSPRKDEIGILSQTFNQMADSVEGRSRELESSRQELARWNLGLESKIEQRTATLKQAEASLKAQMELTDRILASTPNAVLVINRERQIILANKAAYEFLPSQEKEITGRQINDVSTFKELDEAISEVLASGKAQLNLEFKYTLNAEEKTLIGQITPMREDAQEILLILRDATTERGRQEQLAHIDRLASIGIVAAGVAHELNNPLTSILGFSQLLSASTDIPEARKRDVETIVNNAQRAATIVRHLLTFARRQKPEKKQIDLNELIKQTLEMRSYQLKANNIEVQAELAPELPGTMADPQQIQQVFVNIIINAEQAMSEAHGGGRLTIKTETIGRTISISFKDDGPGISKENMRRLFTPFFTTREPGKGTGLGLSISHAIIEEHGGEIYAESEEGKGATFSVELPVVTPEEAASPSL